MVTERRNLSSLLNDNNYNKRLSLYRASLEKVEFLGVTFLGNYIVVYFLSFMELLGDDFCFVSFS